MLFGPSLVTHQEENSVKLKLKRRHDYNRFIRTYQALLLLFSMYSTRPHCCVLSI